MFWFLQGVEKQSKKSTNLVSNQSHEKTNLNPAQSAPFLLASANKAIVRGWCNYINNKETKGFVFVRQTKFLHTL